MIRPEVAALLRQWSEPAIAVAITAAALWIVGLPGFRLGWVSVILGLPIGIAGLIWLRVAVRRALNPAQAGQGSLFVEERRVLYVGSFGNVQVDLDEATRIEVLSRTDAASLMVHVPDGPPVALPLGAEGADKLLDALTGLPGLNMETVLTRLERAQRAGAGQGITTVWTRS